MLMDYVQIILLFYLWFSEVQSKKRDNSYTNISANLLLSSGYVRHTLRTYSKYYLDEGNKLAETLVKCLFVCFFFSTQPR